MSHHVALGLSHPTEPRINKLEPSLRKSQSICHKVYQLIIVLLLLSSRAMSSHNFVSCRISEMSTVDVGTVDGFQVSVYMYMRIVW